MDLCATVPQTHLFVNVPSCPVSLLSHPADCQDMASWPCVSLFCKPRATVSRYQGLVEMLFYYFLQDWSHYSWVFSKSPVPISPRSVPVLTAPIPTHSGRQCILIDDISYNKPLSNRSILKEINPERSLEGLMLTLKRQYFGHLMQRADSLEKTDAGKD